VKLIVTLLVGCLELLPTTLKWPEAIQEFYFVEMTQNSATAILFY